MLSLRYNACSELQLSLSLSLSLGRLVNGVSDMFILFGEVHYFALVKVALFEFLSTQYLSKFKTIPPSAISYVLIYESCKVLCTLADFFEYLSASA